MRHNRPMILMLTGLALMLVGWAVIFVTVIGMLAAHYATLIGAYSASMGGLVVGLIGMLEHRQFGK